MTDVRAQKSLTRETSFKPKADEQNAARLCRRFGYAGSGPTSGNGGTRNGIQQRYRYQRDQAEHEVDAVMCDF